MRHGQYIPLQCRAGALGRKSLPRLALASPLPVNAAHGFSHVNEVPGLCFTEAEQRQGMRELCSLQPGAPGAGGGGRGQPHGNGPCPCGFGRRGWGDAFYFPHLQPMLPCHCQVTLQILGT